LDSGEPARAPDRELFAVRDGIPPKPHSVSGFKAPVRWLLSSRLLGSLRKIALYSFSKRDLDIRDWMQPAVDLSFAQETGDFWFDYIADTGDAQLGVYNLAYLCLSDLHEAPDGDERLMLDVRPSCMLRPSASRTN
jgi:hypothetical protein